MRFPCAIGSGDVRGRVAGGNNFPAACRAEGRIDGDAAAATQAPAASAAAAAPASANPQQAYTLPPDKLAKAIATEPHPQHSEYCRTRSGASSSCGCCWRRAAGQGWRRGRRGFRAGAGFRGWCFSPRTSSSRSWPGCRWTGWPALRARLRDQRAGWGSWFWRRGKGAGADAAVRRADSAALQLDCAALAAALLAGALGGHAADSGSCHLCCAAVRASLLQAGAAQKNHAALVAKLETVVARTGINIPPDRMYLMKASAKSNGINAFVAGIGATKRYRDVGYDDGPDAGRSKCLFIFGHESGHYVLHHIPKEIGGDALGLFFVYWACAGFAAWMVQAVWGALGRGGAVVADRICGAAVRDFDCQLSAGAGGQRLQPPL